jgi:hypothetical protein
MNFFGQQRYELELAMAVSASLAVPSNSIVDPSVSPKEGSPPEKKGLDDDAVVIAAKSGSMIRDLCEVVIKHHEKALKQCFPSAVQEQLKQAEDRADKYRRIILNLVSKRDEDAKKQKELHDKEIAGLESKRDEYAKIIGKLQLDAEKQKEIHDEEIARLTARNHIMRDINADLQIHMERYRIANEDLRRKLDQYEKKQDSPLAEDIPVKEGKTKPAGNKPAISEPDPRSKWLMYSWSYCNSGELCDTGNHVHDWSPCTDGLNWLLNRSFLDRVSDLKTDIWVFELTIPDIAAPYNISLPAQGWQMNLKTQRRRKIQGVPFNMKTWGLKECHPRTFHSIRRIATGPSLDEKEGKKGYELRALWITSLSWPKDIDAAIIQAQLTACAHSWEKLHGDRFIITLTEAKRVINPRLASVFMAEAHNQPKMIWLFHGFSDSNLRSILQHGLRSSTADRGLWGRANYGATNILECITGGYATVKPPAGFHSAISQAISPAKSYKKKDLRTLETQILLVAALVDCPLWFPKGTSCPKDKAPMVEGQLVSCSVGPSVNSDVNNVAIVHDSWLYVTHLITVSVL